MAVIANHLFNCSWIDLLGLQQNLPRNHKNQLKMAVRQMLWLINFQKRKSLHCLKKCW